METRIGWEDDGTIGRVCDRVIGLAGQQRKVAANLVELKWVKEVVGDAAARLNLDGPGRLRLQTALGTILQLHQSPVLREDGRLLLEHRETALIQMIMENLEAKGI